MLKKRIVASVVAAAMLCGMVGTASAAHYEPGWGTDTLMKLDFNAPFEPLVSTSSLLDNTPVPLTRGVSYARKWSTASLSQVIEDDKTALKHTLVKGDNRSELFFDLPEEQEINPGDVITISMDYKYQAAGDDGKAFNMDIGLVNDGKKISTPGYSGAGSDVAAKPLTNTDYFVEMKQTNTEGATRFGLGETSWVAIKMENGKWYHLDIIIDTGAEGTDQTATTILSTLDESNITCLNSEVSKNSLKMVRTLDADASDEAVTKYTKLSSLRMNMSGINNDFSQYFDNVTFKLEHEMQVLVSDLERTIVDVDFEGATVGAISSTVDYADVIGAATAGKVQHRSPWADAAALTTAVVTDAERGRHYQADVNVAEGQQATYRLLLTPTGDPVAINAGDELHISFDHYFSGNNKDSLYIHLNSNLSSPSVSYGYYSKKAPTWIKSEMNASLLRIKGNKLMIAGSSSEDNSAAITMPQDAWYTIQLIIKTVDNSEYGTLTNGEETPITDCQTLSVIATGADGSKYEFCGVLDANYHSENLNNGAIGAATVYNEAKTDGIQKITQFENLEIRDDYIALGGAYTRKLDNLKVSLVTPGIEAIGVAMVDPAQQGFKPGEEVQLAVRAPKVVYADATKSSSFDIYCGQYDENGELIDVINKTWTASAAEYSTTISCPTKVEARSIKAFLHTAGTLHPEVTPLDLTGL